MLFGAKYGADMPCNITAIFDDWELARHESHATARLPLAAAGTLTAGWLTKVADQFRCFIPAPSQGLQHLSPCYSCISPMFTNLPSQIFFSYPLPGSLTAVHDLPIGYNPPYHILLMPL